MATSFPSFPAVNETELIAELRKNFRNKYIDAADAKLEKFDQRDVNRIWNDDRFALSFVHWKKNVVKDAVEMVAQVLEWRKEHGVTDLSVDGIGREYFARGCLYLHGRAVDRTRVFCLLGRLQTKEEKESMRKVFMFWLERLQRNAPGKHVTFVLDTHKTAMSNVDLGMIRFIIDSFTTYFPDLLERIIILDMPWIMNAIWKIVKQWMSEEQRSRVVFCTRKDLKQYIAVEQRPKDMAGTSDWEFSFPPFPDDLSQDFDFVNDPMNLEKEEQQSTSSTVTSHSSHENQNGGPHIQANNNLKRNSEMEVDADVIQGQSKPDPQPTPVYSTPVKNGSVVNGSDRTSTPRSDDPTKLKKISPKTQKNQGQRSMLPTQEETKPQDGPRVPDNDVPTTAKVPPNSSFMSIALNDEPSSRGRLKLDTTTEEINLGNLLVMSPVSELTFTVEEERLESYIHIRNPHPMVDEIDRRIYVAYKVKTTSPELYHVKPSLGVVQPGETVRIRIYLSPGHESTMPKDRFLLLYKPIPGMEDDDSFSHSEIVKFWKKYADKSAHFEHRLRVKDPGSSKLDNAVERRPSEMDVKKATPSTPVTTFQEDASKSVEYSQLHQQLALLNNKITRLESDSRWMRRRMRHTIGLFFVVIFLLLVLLYEVLMVSYNGQTSCTDDL